MSAQRRRSVRVGAALAALAGIVVMAALIAYQDLDALGAMLLTAGWGISLVVLLHLVPMAASALAWQAITRPAWRGGFAVFAWARLVREAVSGLLPVSQVGGDAIGARILTFHGARGATATAGVLADMTVELITQILFTIVGVLILLVHGGGLVLDGALAGLAIGILVTAGFLLAQRWGLFRLLERFLERIAGWLGWAGMGTFANLHDIVLSLYRDRRALAAAHGWHLVSWVIGAAEVWLTLHLFGVEAGFAAALAIESLGQAVRSAAFLVPGAFGVQEGGFLVIGMAFGLGPEAALAVSLVKRIRELVLGGPALIAWQFVEGRRLLDTLSADRGERP